MGEQHERGRVPRGIVVAAIILLVACIEPVTHAWIELSPPPGAVPTGMHTGDSGHHLLAMRSFRNGFFSPFVTCDDAATANDFRYYANPFLLLYGVVGEIGRILKAPPFLFLGLINGLGVVLYLLAVYAFMRRIVPQLAVRAFVLFAVGGGVGGVAFVYCQAQGWVDLPWFQQYFERFAWYDLIEGQHVSPALLAPRFYYTLPLALGYMALNALVDTDRRFCPRHLFYTLFLVVVCGTLNARVAPMIAGIGVLYLLLGSAQHIATRAPLLLLWLLSTVFGVGLYVLVTQQHPTYLENVAQHTHEVALLIPLIFATFWLWPLAKPAAAKAMPGLPWWGWYLACGLTGYLSAYMILYLGYQAYYGNLWFGGDTSAAIAVSDWALLGIGAGVLVGFLLRWTLFRPGRALETWRGSDLAFAPLAKDQVWIVLWALGVMAIAISATGDGWLMRFTPERLLVILGVPLALLAAAGVHVLPPALGRTLYALCVSFGLVSLAVGASYFQGHAGHVPGTRQPFDYLHYAHMTQDDSHLLTRLPEGTVIAPPWSPIAFSEILALRPNTTVIGGPGAMNIGSAPFDYLQGDVAAFFAEETGDSARRTIAKRYCIEYVYCPDTAPITAATIRAFQHTPWLKPVAAAGEGRLYLVALE